MFSIHGVNVLYDVFICHASEDKDDFVRPLAEALQSHHIEVWYDEFSLTVGDSLRQAIDQGLASTRFGIVVLSPSFFKKGWANHELNGLVSRHIAERNLILPIWHNVGHEDVLKFSPPIADMVAISSATGMETVVDDLLRKIRPEESPLITARDFLIEKGLTPPVISDEWWLDIVETKEADFLYPDLNHEWHWIFPLPYPLGARGKERGLDIAWTALQLDWAEDGAVRKICQLTHPEIVHDFLEQWPGLHEFAHDNPEILALYAPQLTIPGFDQGFENAFDELLSPEHFDQCEAFRYGRADTIDGNDPLCGDFIAWRHPTFGNFTAAELSYKFVTAHNTSYSRHVFTGFECLIWLLCDDAEWMPEKLRDILQRGFKDRVQWWISTQYNEDILAILWNGSRSRFSYSKTLKAALLDQCNYALHELKIDEDPNTICSRFIEHGFLEGYYDERDRIQQCRQET